MYHDLRGTQRIRQLGGASLWGGEANVVVDMLLPVAINITNFLTPPHHTATAAGKLKVIFNVRNRKRYKYFITCFTYVSNVEVEYTFTRNECPEILMLSLKYFLFAFSS